MNSNRPPEILVPEVRDYHRINQEAIRLLESGHPRIRLIGVTGQRLLLSGLQGPWSAVIELDGTPGPDLAEGLQAPGLIIVVLGSAGAGAGSNLSAGRLLILRDAAEAVGAGQRGGLIVVGATAGHRAGLRQSGGALYLLGSVGRLVGDRRTNGLLVLDARLARLPFGRGTFDQPWVDLCSDAPHRLIPPADRAAMAESLKITGLVSIAGDPVTRLLTMNRDD